MESVEKIEAIINDYYNGVKLADSLANHRCSRRGFYETIAAIPHLGDAYSRARQAQAHTFSDEIIDIADTDIDPQRARNRIEARKWYASKVEPHTYGDRVDINVTTVDLNAALSEARSRLSARCQPAKEVQADIVDNKSLVDKRATDSKSPEQLGVDEEPKEITSNSIFD